MFMMENFQNKKISKKDQVKLMYYVIIQRNT